MIALRSGGIPTAAAAKGEVDGKAETPIFETEVVHHPSKGDWEDNRGVDLRISAAVGIREALVLALPNYRFDVEHGVRPPLNEPKCGRIPKDGRRRAIHGASIGAPHLKA